MDGSSTSESVASCGRYVFFAGSVLPLWTHASGTPLGSDPGSGFARAHSGIGRFCGEGCDFETSLYLPIAKHITEFFIGLPLGRDCVVIGSPQPQPHSPPIADG